MHVSCDIPWSSRGTCFWTKHIVSPFRISISWVWKWYHNTFTPSLHLVPFCQLALPCASCVHRRGRHSSPRHRVSCKWCTSSYSAVCRKSRRKEPRKRKQWPNTKGTKAATFSELHKVVDQQHTHLQDLEAECERLQLKVKRGTRKKGAGMLQWILTAFKIQFWHTEQKGPIFHHMQGRLVLGLVIPPIQAYSCTGILRVIQ